MNAGDEQQHTVGRIEQSTRALLLASADRLSGTVRSRLRQARHAAVRARGQHRQLRLQRWAPAGAVATAALALFVVLAPHRSTPPIMPVANDALEDIDLLASDVPLNGVQGVNNNNNEFYEWAADEASSGLGAGAVSAAGVPSSGM